MFTFSCTLSCIHIRCIRITLYFFLIFITAAIMYKQCQKFNNKNNWCSNKHNWNTLNSILSQENNTIYQSAVDGNQNNRSDDHIQWRRQFADTVCNTAYNRSDDRTSQQTSCFDTSDNTEIRTNDPAIGHNHKSGCTIAVHITIHLQQSADHHHKCRCHCNHHNQCNFSKDLVPPCQADAVITTFHTR